MVGMRTWNWVNTLICVCALTVPLINYSTLGRRLSTLLLNSFSSEAGMMSYSPGRKAGCGDWVGYGSMEATTWGPEGLWRDSRRGDSDHLDRSTPLLSYYVVSMSIGSALKSKIPISFLSSPLAQQSCQGQKITTGLSQWTCAIFLTRLIRTWDYLICDWEKHRAPPFLWMAWCSVVMSGDNIGHRCHMYKDREKWTVRK